MLHRGCEEVLERFALETICFKDKRKEDSTTLRGCPAVLGHLGDFSFSGCPTLCLCLMSGEGFAMMMMMMMMMMIKYFFKQQLYKLVNESLTLI